MKLWLINLLKSMLFKLDPEYYKGPTYTITPKGISPYKSKKVRVKTFEDHLPLYLEHYRQEYWERKAAYQKRLSDRA